MMTALVDKNHNWALTVLIVCFLAVSNHAVLAVHLIQSEHDYSHCNGNCESEDTGDKSQKHDSSICDFCKQLIGSSGQLICNSEFSVTLSVDHVTLQNYYKSISINQYYLSSNLTRGPPLS